MANAQISLAGPDSIYVSNLSYDGQVSSVLLRYDGGTTASVAAVYGSTGKLIPDSVGLSQAELTFVAPDSLQISNVNVGGAGFTGTLQYIGNGQARVIDLQRVSLPPTEADMAQSDADRMSDFANSAALENSALKTQVADQADQITSLEHEVSDCLLYTSPSPRDRG